MFFTSISSCKYLIMLLEFGLFWSSWSGIVDRRFVFYSDFMIFPFCIIRRAAKINWVLIFFWRSCEFRVLDCVVWTSHFSYWLCLFNFLLFNGLTRLLLLLWWYECMMIHFPNIAYLLAALYRNYVRKVKTRSVCFFFLFFLPKGFVE